ncbi:MAG: sulfotransferase [bacterium]
MATACTVTGKGVGEALSVCPDPVFVIGCPRSGTSVLSHSLARHSRMWLGEESDFLLPLARRAREVHAFGTQRQKYHWLSAQGVTPDEFLRFIGIGMNALYTDRSGGRRWVEQTPQYTLDLPSIAAMFPGARFVHIVRDAGEVVLSMLHSGFEWPWAKDFEEACRTWVRFVEAALAFEAERPDACLRVRLRDLSEDREQGFRRILDFLGLPYEPAGAELLAGRRLNSSFKGADAERPRWQEAFSAGQKAFLAEVCGPLLVRLGLEGSAASLKAGLGLDGACADAAPPGTVAEAAASRAGSGSAEHGRVCAAPRPTPAPVGEVEALKSEVQGLRRRWDVVRRECGRLSGLGETLFSTGRRAEASELFRALAEIAPEDARNWNNLGVAFYEGGRIPQAAEAFRKALEIDSTFDLPRENLARLAADTGRDGAAGRVRREVPAVGAKMKEDWNRRAGENALHYIKSDRKQWDEAAFFETGKGDVQRLILDDLDFLCGARAPRELRLLEIGCGVGRMSRHLADAFGEVCGVDVSGEMIDRARRLHAERANLKFYETDGSSLEPFSDGYFDIVFSFIVFQHVPSKDVLMRNFREIRRVVKPGGAVKIQVHGVTSPEYARVKKDTWLGVSFAEEEMRAISAALGFQVEGMSGAGTQYFWIKWRVPPASLAAERGPLESGPTAPTGQRDASGG